MPRENSVWTLRWSNLQNVKITGKLRDTETVMRSLEGGGWKSTSNGNSLATYPTRKHGFGREGWSGNTPLDSTSRRTPIDV
jgi:hypothetical protein